MELIAYLLYPFVAMALAVVYGALEHLLCNPDHWPKKPQ